MQDNSVFLGIKYVFLVKTDYETFSYFLQFSLKSDPKSW